MKSTGIPNLFKLFQSLGLLYPIFTEFETLEKLSMIKLQQIILQHQYHGRKSEKHDHGCRDHDGF
jgi:hypothetical protein